jgi:hypothetical protein
MLGVWLADGWPHSQPAPISLRYACTKPGLPQDFWPPTPDDLEAAGAALYARPVTKLLPPAAAAGGAAWPTVRLSDSVRHVVGVFASSQVQHILVQEEGGGADPLITTVVSQSDVVK